MFNELLDYIDNNRGSGTPMEMADLTMLTALYDKRLVALGFPDIKCNTTCLREDIECLVPDIKLPVRMNRCWSFVFDDDMGRVVGDIMKDNISTEVSILHKAAKSYAVNISQ